MRDVLEIAFIIVLVLAMVFLITWTDSPEDEDRRTPLEPHIRQPPCGKNPPASLSRPASRPGAEGKPTMRNGAENSTGAPPQTTASQPARDGVVA